MYIAINGKLAHYDLQRALRFRLQANTITEMLHKINQSNNKWYDYIIFTVE